MFKVVICYTLQSRNGPQLSGRGKSVQEYVVASMNDEGEPDM